MLWSVAMDGAIVLSAQALFFGFAMAFFRRKLFKDYEVKDQSVQLLFSATFTLSCTFFLL